MAINRDKSLLDDSKDDFHTFSFRKMLVIFVILILWTGMFGFIEHILEMAMGKEPSNYQRFLYNAGLIVVGFIAVYTLNISPGLII